MEISTHQSKSGVVVWITGADGEAMASGGILCDAGARIEVVLFETLGAGASWCCYCCFHKFEG